VIGDATCRRREAVEHRAMNSAHAHLTGRPSRVLVPVDDDDAGSAAAVDAAAGLAQALDAELVLVAMLPGAVVMPAYPAALAVATEDVLPDGAEIDRIRAQRRSAVASRLPAGVRSRWIDGRKPAGEAIVGAADETDADLVVVPMHRGGGLAHALRDGADRHVLHHSRVPVLVVPAD
jgi:nucleotide-binding universal stress UspA family protein